MEIAKCHSASRTHKYATGLRGCSDLRRRGLRQTSCRASRAAASDPAQACRDADSCTRRAAMSTAVLLGALAGAAGLPAQPAGAAELQTSSSGLKYEDTKVGAGKEATKGTVIRCHYTGRLSSNGQVFDSSYERRRPLSFTIGVRQVIQGWDLGIVGTDDIPAMKEGGKRRLVIPPELGYGSRGAGGKIPPNSELIFDVEYLGKK